MQRWRNKYPGFSDEAYDAMDRAKSGPIPKSKHDEALKLWGEGKSRDEIGKALGFSSAALFISRKHDPHFAELWNEISSKRVKQVDDKLVETVLKGSLEIRTTRVPVLDSDGKPLFVNGTQRFYISKIEEVQRPVSPELLQFFLRNRSRMYGAEGESSGADMIGVEDLRKSIDDKLKVYAGTA
jgi:hypothetical protein